MTNKDYFYRIMLIVVIMIISFLMGFFAYANPVPDQYQKKDIFASFPRDVTVTASVHCSPEQIRVEEDVNYGHMCQLQMVHVKGIGTKSVYRCGLYLENGVNVTRGLTRFGGINWMTVVNLELPIGLTIDDIVSASCKYA